MPSKYAVNLVRKYFPNVKEVRDAEQDLDIDVTATDLASAKRKSHSNCVYALACKRSLNLDGALFSRSIAYLVVGESAIRFQVPTRVRTELISFDRGAAFTLGTYTLNKVGKAHKLGKGHAKDRFLTSYGPRKHKHFVLPGVRAVLGAKSDTV